MRKYLLKYMALGFSEMEASEVIDNAIKTSQSLPISAYSILCGMHRVIAAREVKGPGIKEIARTYIAAVKKSNCRISPESYIAISRLCIRN